MTEYKRLRERGITVYSEPVAHVSDADLKEALTEGELRKFGELFGVQTCPYVEGKDYCVYPWDAEAVLERMASGTLTGTQLFWD